MASYQRFDSPAKVFAKLKSKVQREEKCANEGASARQDPLCEAKLGAKFKSAMKRAEGTWMSDELGEDPAVAACDEARALTISPTSSPQKSSGYAFLHNSQPVEDEAPVTGRGHGCTPRKRAFLESTAVSQPVFLANRKHTQANEASHIIDFNGFEVTSRTPVKIQPAKIDTMFDTERAPLVPSAGALSPVSKRLRKRKWEPRAFNNVSSEVTGEPKERKREKKPRVEDLVHVRGLSPGLTHEPLFPPPGSTAKKRCYVILDKGPLMSPAKIFADMKERESRAEQQEACTVSSSMRDLFDRGKFHRSRDARLSTTQDVGDKEDTALTEGLVPVSQSRAESADSQSDTDPSEDVWVQVPAVPSHPVLLEDPLIINSPRISIPKKNEPVLKRNNWSQAQKSPRESVIYLKRWVIRRNRKGLFVDGIHGEKNIAWCSNIIVERVSNYVLRTVTGRVYILVGKMMLQMDSGFPKWFSKKFSNGFPPNWKELHEKFLSESRDSSKTETERSSTAKAKSEASATQLSVRAKCFKTPDACPPSPSSFTRVSRSGRIIKAPLEYWKGGRVVVDAHMNVIVHKSYDAYICNPEVTINVSAEALQTPTHVIPPSGEDCRQSDSTSETEASVLQRKAKAPLSRRTRAKVNRKQKTSRSPRPPAETLSGPGEGSAQRRHAAEGTLTVETKPQKTLNTEGKKAETARVSGRKKAIPASPQSPAVKGQTSRDLSSNDDVSTRRKRRAKAEHKKRGEESPQPLRLSVKSGKELRKKTAAGATKNRDAAKAAEHKQSKSNKKSQPTKPKSTQSSKKRKTDRGSAPTPPERDEDEWTEEELSKLKRAVALHPKHAADYWENVARTVGTRSAEECYNQHTAQGTLRSPAKKGKKAKREAVKAPNGPDNRVMFAGVGTLKRKQQVRHFLANMPKDNDYDAFSCTSMQQKRSEIPSTYPLRLNDDRDFTRVSMTPVSPTSTSFPEVKTPQCLPIPPDMMGSPSSSDDDKYVFRLQKRIKTNRFNVCKLAPSSKKLGPTPSVKRAMRRCSNTEKDTLLVWEMFPGNDGALSDSEEEEDFYFSDD